ncbi:MAG: peptidoglycan-associated lipoprotein [Desulfuromonas sp.]|nr:MAG: peptidoglycan-associated lipoprotein [Desulfuromonas sp.]
MQNRALIRLFVLLALALMLTTGCAKKTAVDDAASSQTGVTETVVDDATEAASSFEEQAVTDSTASATLTAAEAEVLVRKLMRVYFDYDQYVLTESAKETLYANAQIMKAAPALQVIVEGHCDERGSDEYNLALGERRALATKNHLVSLGVSADQLGTLSYGEEVPLVLGRSEDAWAKNRRAEFTLQR